MSDTQQAVYDAVRSRISGCDVGSVVSNAVREAFDISWQKGQLTEAIQITAYEIQRPSVLYRPSIECDGNKWCALYGPNLMQGVCGYGDTPAEAMADFDKNWTSQKAVAA
jgi:hypothetical protein